MSKKQVEIFREHIEKTFQNGNRTSGASFGEILCHEIHEQVFNPRMNGKTGNDGYCTGLTFNELAKKWGISVSFLGEVIADHCRKLEPIPSKCSECGQKVKVLE